MRILAIETSSALGGVALLQGERVVRSIEEDVPRRHLEWLAPAIQTLLREAAWEVPLVEAVAVSQGPGGFTSLRIGIATAVAWARAREIPAVAVSTHAALAAGVGSQGTVCTMLDARHGDVSAAVFASNGAEPRRLVDDLVAPVEHVLEKLPSQGPITFAGDALVTYEGEVVARLGERAIIAPRGKWTPRVVNVGRIGWRRLMRGERDDLYHVWPVYARLPASENAETRKRGN